MNKAKATPKGVAFVLFLRQNMFHPVRKTSDIIDRIRNICYNILATQLHIAITVYKCVFFF